MSRSSRSRSAFTLVELLVVIAIIGVLVGLLLPAVNQAREAARKASCSNNLKQMHIALTSFESSYQKYPPGAFSNSGPWGKGTNGQMGTNWSIHLLPYMEQRNLYNDLSFAATGTPNGFVNDANYIVASNAGVGNYKCPSSRLNFRETNDITFTITPPPAANPDAFDFVLINHYVGIAGSVMPLYNPAAAGVVTDRDYYDGLFGISATNGVFGIGKATRISDVTDGMGNTLIISEQNGELNTTNGETILGSGVLHGWLPGAFFDSPLRRSTLTPGTIDNRHNQCTTVAFEINQRDLTPGTPFPSWSASAEPFVLSGPVGAGLSYSVNNTPLSSFHPGGVMALFGDGQVRFLSNNLPANILHAYCTVSGEELYDDAEYR